MKNWVFFNSSQQLAFLTHRDNLLLSGKKRKINFPSCEFEHLWEKLPDDWLYQNFAVPLIRVGSVLPRPLHFYWLETRPWFCDKHNFCNIQYILFDLITQNLENSLRWKRTTFFKWNTCSYMQWIFVTPSTFVYTMQVLSFCVCVRPLNLEYIVINDIK